MSTTVFDSPITARLHFGKQITNLSLNPSGQKLRYNGKELQDQNLGGRQLDWYDYGARFYDPTLGRFHTADPHAENYNGWTPFNYVANNPIILTDPDGRGWYQDQAGNTMWKQGSGAVEGYENIGASHTQDFGNGVSITFEKNEMKTITETFLSDGAFASQMTGEKNADGNFKTNANGTFPKKQGEEGNCNSQTREMVSKTGATMAGSGNDAANPVDYAVIEAKKGKSVGMHVDDNGRNGAETGDHWVASSSMTTDIATQKTTKIGFLDPAGPGISLGRGSLNVVGRTARGVSSYNKERRYKLVNVRKNLK